MSAARKGTEPFRTDGDNELFRLGVATGSIRQLAFETGCWLFSAFFPMQLRGSKKKEEMQISEPGCPSQTAIMLIFFEYLETAAKFPESTCVFSIMCIGP